MDSPKPAQRQREPTTPQRLRPSRQATFVYIRNWQRPRAGCFIKLVRKKSGFKGSSSDQRYLGLFLLPVHADGGIKQQPTFL